MRKGCDGEKKEWKTNNDVYSGHYVIASSQPPEGWPLERRTLVPIYSKNVWELGSKVPGFLHVCPIMFIVFIQLIVTKFLILFSWWKYSVCIIMNV